MRSRSRLVPLALCLALGACKASVTPMTQKDDDGPASDDDDPIGDDGAGGAGGAPTDEPTTPLNPGDIASSCQVDAPFPRRLMRVSPRELAATLARLSPVDPASFPAAFAPKGIVGGVDASLTVSRDFQENADALAQTFAAKVAASPGATLTCPVASFGKDAACTKAYVTRATGILFRGTGGSEEVDGLVKLAADVAAISDGRSALELTVRAMVLSPRTLYFTEGLDLPAGADPTRPTKLSPGEMATFLASRITNGAPSDALVAALRAKPPKTEAELAAIVDASFTGADLAHGLTDFLADWLNVADIPNLRRSAEKHPAADEAFMLALQKETYEAIGKLAGTSGVTFARAMSDELRSGLAKDEGNQALATTGRPGLFTLPGVLAAVSSSDHTNIPRRGRYLLKQLLCDIVPPPPPTLDTTLPPLPGKPSWRQKFERVEMEPTCSGCHVRVNHLAFALESFDELGRARVVDDDGNPIVTDGVHTIEGFSELRFSDARDLFRQAGDHPAARACLVIQTFRHTARRPERGALDACLVKDLAADSERGGYGLVDLFKRAVIRGALADRAN